jgi:replicative DNA helicase
MDGKFPPHSIDSEESLLGALIIDGGGVFPRVSNLVKPMDFYSERNKQVFEACLELNKRHEKINQITIAQELARDEKLKNIGGAAYLSHCISVCPTPLDAESFADIIYRLSVSRQLIGLSEQISEIGYEARPDTNQMLSQVSDMVEDFKKGHVLTNSICLTPYQFADNMLNTFKTRIDPRESTSWGFKDLDNITSGIYPELIVIGGRPSTGKTQLMLDIAQNIDDQKKSILYVSAEMNQNQIQERLIARETGISVNDLRRYGLPEEKSPLFMELVGRIGNGHMHFITGSVTATDIYNEVNHLMSTVGINVVFVDYLQFLRDCWVETKENQNIRVGRAIKILKNIVSDFDVAVIVASQLNRSLEYRTGENRRPNLSDLRDSGNIEQDADVVLLLHREQADEYKLSSNLQIKMAKNRQLGQAPHIELAWLESRHRYVDCYQGKA